MFRRRGYLRNRCVCVIRLWALLIQPATARICIAGAPAFGHLGHRAGRAPGTPGIAHCVSCVRFSPGHRRLRKFTPLRFRTAASIHQRRRRSRVTTRLRLHRAWAGRTPGPIIRFRALQCFASRHTVSIPAALLVFAAPNNFAASTASICSGLTEHIYSAAPIINSASRSRRNSAFTGPGRAPLRLRAAPGRHLLRQFWPPFRSPGLHSNLRRRPMAFALRRALLR